MDRPSIAICTPVREGFSPEYLETVLGVTHALAARGWEWRLVWKWGAPVTHARDNVAARFLAETTCTHALWIDADCGFDPSLLWRLLALKVDFAALPFLIRGRGDADHVPNFRADATQPMVNGAVRAAWVGFGTVLMRRSVLERLTAAHPELHHDTPWPGVALFQEMVIDGPAGLRETTGEDCAFGLRWQKLGGELWVLVDEVHTWHAARELHFRWDGHRPAPPPAKPAEHRDGECLCGSGSPFAQCHGREAAAE